MLRLSVLLFTVFWLAGVLILAETWKSDSQALIQILFLCAPQTIFLLAISVWVCLKRDKHQFNA